MANRTRPIRIEFCVSENEHRIIKSKMAQLGTKNMGAYLRKMAIDGYIIKVDYTQQKKLAAAVSRAASNINQICRRINSKGNLYENDVTELKERQKEIWQLLKSSQSRNCKQGACLHPRPGEDGRSALCFLFRLCCQRRGCKGI